MSINKQIATRCAELLELDYKIINGNYVAINGMIFSPGLNSNDMGKAIDF